MKYTIFGFNQIKLCEYGLDTNDAMILQWLIDFASTNKMKKTIENNEIYYLVRYEAVIKEFPVMGINSIKAITNRFEKYVKSGLLKRIVKRGGNGRGCMTCYALTPLLNEMKYDPAQNNDTIQIIDTETENNDTDSNQTSYRKENNTDSNLNSYRENNSTDSNQTSYRETDRNLNSSRQESKFSPIGTKLPVGLNNQSINLSIKNSSSTKQQKKEDLIKILNYYVDTHSFSDDFIPKLLDKLDEFYILPGDYKTFVDYAYKACYEKTKDKNKLMSYIYATFTDNYFISGFVENQKKQTELKVLYNITCPVCGTEHNKYCDCPVCELKNPKSQIEINFRKTIFSLPTQDKNNLKKELESLFINNDEPLEKRMNEYKNKRELIYQKYGNFSHEDLVTIFGA